MEVMTYVFGSENSVETIEFADLSFLQKRISVESSKSYDSLTIFLNGDNLVHLINRLFKELFGKRFIEVILNPCLRNEDVIKGIKIKLKGLSDEGKLELIIKPHKNTEKQELRNIMKKAGILDWSLLVLSLNYLRFLL